MTMKGNINELDELDEIIKNKWIHMGLDERINELIWDYSIYHVYLKMNIKEIILYIRGIKIINTIFK